MRQCLYVSSSVGIMPDAEIAEILELSRRNNARDGITGMLLYCDGNFLQLLEGKDEVVEETFRRIEADPRHTGVVVMLDEKVPQRAFGDWSMGFEKLQQSSNPDAEAAFQIGRLAIDRRITPGNFWAVRRMMETFYEINTRKSLNLTQAAESSLHAPHRSAS